MKINHLSKRAAWSSFFICWMLLGLLVTYHIIDYKVFIYTLNIVSALFFIVFCMYLMSDIKEKKSWYISALYCIAMILAYIVAKGWIRYY